MLLLSFSLITGHCCITFRGAEEMSYKKDRNQNLLKLEFVRRLLFRFFHEFENVRLVLPKKDVYNGVGI